MSVISTQAIDYYDAGSAHTHWVYPVARTLETLEYDPYGRSKRTKLADYDRTSTFTSSDLMAFTAAWNATSHRPTQGEGGSPNTGPAQSAEPVA